MWRPGSSSWPTQGIAVKIFIRFFIVVFAHDFVKNGQFEVRLFHQIYWLAWMARVGKNATLNAKKRQEREAKTPIIRFLDLIFVEKNMSCGEISDFCKEFEQFMEFYGNLCRFCSKFVWRKICVEKICVEKK